MHERILDRIPNRKESQLRYQIEEDKQPLYTDAKLLLARVRGYTYHKPGRILDQGREGACVGFGITAGINAGPVRPKPQLTEIDAHRLYKIAQTMDYWPGENYSGSSVDGGAQAALSEGRIVRYEWTYDIETASNYVAAYGPLVMGTHFKTEMFEPDSNGIIKYEGNIEGGHCYLWVGESTRKRINGRLQHLCKIQQSWGPTHGINGFVWITIEDMAKALQDQGDACALIEK